MHFHKSAALGALLAFTAATNTETDAQIQRRDAVANCRAVLIALRASAFCSSFASIIDVTSTATGSGSVATATVAGPPCTTTAPAKLTTTTETSTNTKTETVTSTTTTAIPFKVRRNGKVAVPTVVAATSKCTIKGVHASLSLFACDIIKQACRLYVKPKIVKVTVAGVHRIATKTIAPICQMTTPKRTTTETTTTTTTTTTTVIATSTDTNERFVSCNNAPGPSVIASDQFNDLCPQPPNQISGSIPCRCKANPGQANGGAGKCSDVTFYGYPCSSDAECRGQRCLGIPNGDGMSPLAYYCSRTIPCVPFPYT